MNKEQKLKVFKIIFTIISFLIIGIILNWNHKPHSIHHETERVVKVEDSPVVEKNEKLIDLSNNQKAIIFLGIPLMIMQLIFISVLFDFFKKIKIWYSSSKIKFM